eukprot:gene11858-15429_t
MPATRSGEAQRYQPNQGKDDGDGYGRRGAADLRRCALGPPAP